MRRIIVCVLSLVFVFSCTKTHKVFLDNNHIAIEGIEAWLRQIQYVPNKISCNVAILVVKSIDSKDLGLYTKCWPYDTIEIVKGLEKFPALIAHEFGHYLGHEHSDNPESIMHPHINISLPLTNFLEFR